QLCVEDKLSIKQSLRSINPSVEIIIEDYKDYSFEPLMSKYLIDFCGTTDEESTPKSQEWESLDLSKMKFHSLPRIVEFMQLIVNG
ncbi:hypothetical protein RCL38_23220, partial [Salmonella enterica subsp. enterica serovar Typhimurium]